MILNLFVNKQTPRIIEEIENIVCLFSSKINSLFNTCVIEYVKNEIYPRTLNVQTNKNNISVC